jgi:hypothetical protein
MDQESLVLEVDPRSVLAAIKQANTAVEGWEKGTVGAGDRMQKSLERMADMLLKMNDRSRSSMERLTQSIEKQAAAYGKTGVDRLVADRDRFIRKLGDEQGMIDRVTAAYAKMIDVESGKSGGSFQALGRNIESFVRDPLNASKDAATGLFASLGPVGTALGVGATALTAFAAAGWEAAKSLGSYGVMVKDAELRTGLTAKEVGQFGFAAKAAGQDVTIFERMMRGLTTAIEDDSAAGEKARGWLARFGVDLAGVRDGSVSTSQVLQQVAAGLDALPTTWDRNKAALDLFKRSGVEAIPVMMELTENLRIAQEQGFGPTDGDIARFTAYQTKVAELETKWGELKRTFQEGLAIEVSFVGSAAKWIFQHLPAETVQGDQASIDQMNAEEQLAGEIRRANAARFGNYPPANTIDALARKRIEALRGLRPEDAFGPEPGDQDYRSPQAQRKIAEAADYQRQIEAAQRKLATDAEADRQKQVEAAGQEADRLRARYFGGHEALEKAYTDAKKDVEKYQQQLATARENKTSMEDVRDTGAKLAAAVRKEAQARAGLDAEEQRKKFAEEAAAFTKKGDDAELGALGKIYYQRDQLLKQAAQVKASEAEIAAIRQSAEEQAAPLAKKAQDEFEAYDRKRALEQSQKLVGLLLPSKAQMKEWEDVDAAQERIQDIGVDAQREALRRQASVAAKGAGTPEEAYQIRVDLATKLGEIEAARMAKETDAAKRMVLAAQAQKDLYTELAAAQDELDEKRAEAARKRTEDLQREIDGLQKTAGGLFHTLFTKPGDFGGQLKSTVREAVIRPVSEGMGGLVANAIHPLIYGAEGQGGIAGAFKGIFGGGKKDPMQVTDENTTATRQNSTAIAALTAVFAGTMGVPVPAIGAPVGGIGNISIPAIAAPAAPGVAPSLPAIFGGGGWGFPSGGGAGAPSPETSGADLGKFSFPPVLGVDTVSGAGVAAPGGGGTPDIYNLPQTPHSATDAGPLAAIKGVTGSGSGGNASGGLYGMFSKEGFSKTLSNLKGTVWNQDAWNAYPSTFGGNLAGGIQGVAKSPAAGAAGMMLAMNGLFGNSRGTWSGIAQSTAGGALIGDQIGGPWGAAIGAGAGFLASLGEKLAGVESPENKAKQLVKQLYSINIDNNMARQIAAIAKQSFGGDVDIAVRSDQVRQLVKLYAEAMGQKSAALTALTPHAASLIESGGKLYQGAVYDNGQAYSYSSSLPVYGGVSTQLLPTASPYAGSAGAASAGVTVNLNPQQTVDLWRTGTTQAMQSNPRLVAQSALNGSQSSAARVGNAVNTLAPSVITQ